MIKQHKAPRLPDGGKSTNKYKNKSANKGKGKNKNMRVMTPGRVALLAVVAIIFIFTLYAYLFLATDLFKPPPPSVVFPKGGFGDEFLPDTDDADIPEDLAGDWNPDCFTFLILGRDEGVHTDTMMLAVFDTKNNTLSILNIPRDIYVTTRGFAGKITNVYGRGRTIARENGFTGTDIADEGIKYLKAMIQYTFGIPVQFHIMIDLKGFKFLVNEIGGVEMDVPIRMFYEDPEQNLYINLYPGVQILNGDKAEQLVRFREGYDSQDLGRIETQQKFIAALLKKLLKADLRTINALFETATKYMETNITAANAAWFASRGMNVKLEDIRTNTVPGAWVYPHLVAYKQETMEIINKYFNPFKKDIPASNFNINDKGANLGSNPDANIDGVNMADLIR